MENTKFLKQQALALEPVAHLLVQQRGIVIVRFEQPYEPQELGPPIGG